VRVIEAELRRVEMSLVAPVTTATERHLERPVLVVRLTTELGPGAGECDALASARYSGESIDTAEVAIVREIIPKLLDRSFEFASVEEAIDAARASSDARMAVASVEMALLDAVLRAQGRSLASYLQAPRLAIPAGATVGIGPVRDVVAKINEAFASGIRRVKLKIAPDVDVVAVRAIRSEFPDVELVVDANGSYSLSDPSHRASLRALDGLGLAAIEQPLKAWQLDGHRQLVKELGTRILLDESITSLDGLDRALDAGACSGVCVKPARLGGILAARAARDRCAAAGIPCAIGGMFEAGLGRAASIAVGALDGFDLGGDLGPSARYFEKDITSAHTLTKGMLLVPMRPGIGVDLREDVLESRTARCERFVAS
jgi:o-succinylbenzoate synthase